MNKPIYFSIIIIAILCADYSYAQIKSNYRCVYSLDVMKDTTTKSHFKKETYIVQIGENVTKGYTYSYYYQDSLQTYDSKEFRRQVSEIVAEISESLKKNINPKAIVDNSKFGRGGFENYAYKKYDKNKISVIEDIAGQHFTYNDELIPQKWEICIDTTTILGYKSQKAICHFRGRDFVAWFTTEIPISEGPWKFYGLPGLITKLHDTKNHYNFELIGFNKSNEDIDVRIRKDTRKISRIEFLKGDASGEFYDKISQASAMNIGFSTGKAPRYYSNIELDYK